MVENRGSLSHRLIGLSRGLNKIIYAWHMVKTKYYFLLFFFFLITSTITYPVTEARNVRVIIVSSVLYSPYPQSPKADATSCGAQEEVSEWVFSK